MNIVWNQRAGQIKTVSQGGTLLATYYYDHQGRRTRKTTAAAAPQGAGTIGYMVCTSRRIPINDSLINTFVI